METTSLVCGGIEVTLGLLIMWRAFAMWQAAQVKGPELPPAIPVIDGRLGPDPYADRRKENAKQWARYCTAQEQVSRELYTLLLCLSTGLLTGAVWLALTHSTWWWLAVVPLGLVEIPLTGIVGFVIVDRILNGGTRRSRLGLLAVGTAFAILAATVYLQLWGVSIWY